MPGICTSLIKQSTSCGRFDFKNASADANWSTAHPRDRMKLVVARRNDSSSSTIAIKGTFDKLPSQMMNVALVALCSCSSHTRYRHMVGDAPFASEIAVSASFDAILTSSLSCETKRLPRIMPAKNTAATVKTIRPSFCGVCCPRSCLFKSSQSRCSISESPSKSPLETVDGRGKLHMKWEIPYETAKASVHIKPAKKASVPVPSSAQCFTMY
jgi:hypothetical protein